MERSGEVRAAPKRIPMGRFVEPEEVAEAIAYLLGDNSAMVARRQLPIDGGSPVN